LGQSGDWWFLVLSSVGLLMIWLGFGVILGRLSFRNISSVHLALLFSAVVDAGIEIILLRKRLLEEEKEVL